MIAAKKSYLKRAKLPEGRAEVVLYKKRQRWKGRESERAIGRGGSAREGTGGERGEGRKGQERGEKRNEGKEIRAVARPSKSWMMTREASRSGLRNAGGGRR